MNPKLHAVLLSLPFALSACRILPEPPAPPAYLVLVPVAELPGAPPAAPRADALDLGLGPVTLPEYLLRVELVAREGTRLLPSATERWAEPLERAVERVLAADLAHALGTGPPRLHPWYATELPDVQVEIVFERFELDGSGEVVADALWTVRDLSGNAAEREGRSTARHPAGPSGETTAFALSRALADVALELAAVVRELTGG